VGIYPELKQPKFHREAGKDLSSIVMRTLAEFGYTGRDARCFVQCFELDEVRRLRQELHCELPLICLLSKDKEWAALLADDASLRQRLRELAGFSEGVGPHLELVVAGASPEGLPRLTAFVRAARETGLQVHGWTFRADQLECGAQSFAQLHEWGRVAGLDGYFSDFPDQTLKYLQQSQQR
jgi:glycerophosphoryl diester phosphodiesterase